MGTERNRRLATPGTPGLDVPAETGADTQTAKDSVLQSLLAECKARRRKRVDRVRAPSACPPLVYQAPMKTTPVCSCGKCSSCRENARWERIFAAKFADADYYKQKLGIHQRSPLSSL